MHEQQKQIEKILLTIEEAAKFLNLKISRLRAAVFKKEITHIKLGRLVRFKIDHLEQWLSAQTKQCVQKEHFLLSGGVL